MRVGDDLCLVVLHISQHVRAYVFSLEYASACYELFLVAMACW
jgi:hypothetical protein